MNNSEAMYQADPELGLLSVLSVYTHCVHVGFLQVLLFPPTSQKTCHYLDFLIVCVNVCVCAHGVL